MRKSFKESVSVFRVFFRKAVKRPLWNDTPTPLEDAQPTDSIQGLALLCNL